MATYSIYEDELYPYFEIEPPNTKYSIEIPDDKVEWIKRVMADFNEVQDYLCELREGKPE